MQMKTPYFGTFILTLGVNLEETKLLTVNPGEVLHLTYFGFHGAVGFDARMFMKVTLGGLIIHTAPCRANSNDWPMGIIIDLWCPPESEIWMIYSTGNATPHNFEVGIMGVVYEYQPRVVDALP